MKEYSIKNRTLKFATDIVHFCENLPHQRAGWVIEDQIIRSGSSIGANVSESQDAFTKKDFIHSMTIALKEGRETIYWLDLILNLQYHKKESVQLLQNECKEICAILAAIIRNTARNEFKKQQART